MAKSINNSDVVWLNEQQHIGTEDVEELIGRFEDRPTRTNKSKYRRARGLTSYYVSQISDSRKMEREKIREAERSALLDPISMANAIGREI
jgi:hypothetical protein